MVGRRKNKGKSCFLSSITSPFIFHFFFPCGYVRRRYERKTVCWAPASSTIPALAPGALGGACRDEDVRQMHSLEDHGEAPGLRLQSLMAICVPLQGLHRRLLSHHGLRRCRSPPPGVCSPSPPQRRVRRHSTLPRLQMDLPRPGNQAKGPRSARP